VVPTTKEFLATLTGTHKVVAGEILSTLCFPEQIDRLGEVLAVVEGLIQYMLMTCPAGIERWKDWASALPELREKAGALERESGVLPPTTRTKGNPWLRCSPPQIVLAFLWIGFDSGPPDEETAFRLNTLKGLLLAAYAAKAFGKMKAGDAETLDHLSTRIRQVYTGKRRKYRNYAPFLPGTRDRDQWLNALEQARLPTPRYHPTPTGFASPAEFNWLNQVRRLSQSLPEVHWSDTVPCARSEHVLFVEPPEEDADDALAPVAQKARRRIQTMTECTPTADVDVEALDPETELAVELEGVATAETSAVPLATANEVRHTNWRTGRDAQRLPWDWTQLNPIELEVLVAAIARAAGNSAQLGAALAWLLLVTGQYLDDALGLLWLSEAPEGISRGGQWTRSIPVPKMAFVPGEDHDGLARHIGQVELALPAFPVAIQETVDRTVASQKAPRTVGEALGLNAAEAAAVLRTFLAEARSENGRRVRFQPGRIRRVLANTLMQITQDKVLTHLLAGLSIEEPPTGVYYVAYPLTVLQDIYAQAMARIFA
jgi:hypothetical protein